MSAAKTGHAHGRELLGHELQGLGLARAGGAGDEAVAVAHGRRDLHDGLGVHGAAEHAPAQFEGGALGGVGGGDAGREVVGVLAGHRARLRVLPAQGAVSASRAWAAARPGVPAMPPVGPVPAPER